MQLPDFPWDRLAGAKARAAAVPGGIVDLSVGTPVDPTPEIVQRALCEAANAPGYPTVHGTPAVRQAAVDWMQRSLDVTVSPDDILPLIGTKEFV
ncbi:MAG TPA: succinyldiaminopimelate transaminase, partial [Candidatus Nanopelagicales bacterium]|nr:succinyldiaminopimelate transaminase [Candidatus Nanopelagicales bacterium]